MNTRYIRSIAFYLLLLFAAIAFAQLLGSRTSPVQEVEASQVYSLVDQGKVKNAVVSSNKVTLTLTDGSQVFAYFPDASTAGNMLTEKNIPWRYDPPRESIWPTLLSSLIPTIIIIVALFFIMQQTQGGGSRVMQFGRSRARLVTNDRQQVTFQDVAGIDEVLQELQEIVDFLKHPKKYMELGARIPKGVLLMGPPGTGKTLVARAVAGEAGVPFFSESGSNFVEMFVGVGASRVRDLFDQAKKNSPCIVFIDEIDAVGRQRGAGYGGGHDEREQTLNQLLVEMDGFGINEGIIVMAATNRPDVLDPALLRPGRFDRQIVIDRPDVRGREAILKVHARGKPLDKDVDISVLARRTPGFTGADLANLMNEAALLAARQRKKRIGMAELEEAIDRVIGGPERKSRILSERERTIVAWHESAHTLAAHLLPHADPVHKVSIISRGAALGYMLQLPAGDRYLVTKAEIMDMITTALAGRAAEEIIFHEISTGAEDDLEKSTKMARRMIMEYGMSEELGPLTYGRKQELVFLGRDIARERDYSEEVAARIDHEVSNVVSSCYERAKAIVSEHRDQLEKLAMALLEKETLEGEELQNLLADLAGAKAPEPPLIGQPGAGPKTAQKPLPPQEKPGLVGAGA